MVNKQTNKQNEQTNKEMTERDTTEVKSEFPYLNNEDIRHLKLAILYRILGSVKATDKEVELIKQKRRRLQKLHFKHKKDSLTNAAIEEMGTELEDLMEEKSELVKMREGLKVEIGQYQNGITQEIKNVIAK